MGNQEGSGYRTSDLYYAAYLRVAGVPFFTKHLIDDQACREYPRT